MKEQRAIKEVVDQLEGLRHETDDLTVLLEFLKEEEDQESLKEMESSLGGLE